MGINTFFNETLNRPIGKKKMSREKGQKEEQISKEREKEKDV